MSYSEVFGGSTLYPSGQTYLALNLSASVELQWATEQQIAGEYVVASIMDVSTSGPGLTITMPDARQASTGMQSVFTNIGANNVIVRDQSLGNIITIQPGEAWVVYLYDNSTEAGSWRTFQLGATVSVASSSALAGAGLVANGLLLDQTAYPRSITVPASTINLADRAKLILYSGTAGSLSLPTAASNTSGWFCFFRNISATDAITLSTSASDPIDGGVSKSIQPQQSCVICFDGTAYYTIGLSSSTAASFSFLIIDTSGPAGTRVLNATEQAYTSIRFIGALTGNRTVTVTNITKEYWISNQTTGAFTFTFKTAAGTGITIPQANAYILYCDGTNIINAATSASLALPIPIAQGGTAAVDIANAQLNLQVPPTSRQIIAGAGLTGTGTLGADVTLNVGAGTGILANANDVALDTANTRNTDHASVTLTAGAGLTGGGTIAANRTFDVGAGTGITVNANDVALDTANARNADHSAISLLNGTGISATGLGNLTASRTINANVASDTVQGVIEIATQAEVDTGTDTTRAVTPATLSGWSLAPTYDKLVYLAATEFRVSTISPSNTSLAFTSVPIGVYRLSGCLFWDNPAGGVAGIRVDVSIPVGSSGTVVYTGGPTNFTMTKIFNWGTDFTMPGVTGTNQLIFIDGLIIVAAVGDVVLRLAQAVSTTENTNLEEQSYLQLKGV